MTARRRKKNPPQPGFLRRWLRRLALAALFLAGALTIAVFWTEPRNLPSLIADHPATRQLYLWRDTVRAETYRMIYPLSDLRSLPTQDDAPASAQESGYNEDDRAALRALIEDKDD